MNKLLIAFRISRAPTFYWSSHSVKAAATAQGGLNHDGTSEPRRTPCVTFSHEEQKSPLVSPLQVFVPTSASCVRKPSHRGAPWSPTWERSTAFTNSTPIDRDVPRSLCVRTVATPPAAPTSTSCTWSSATLGALPSADTTAATAVTPAASHLQIANFIHSWRIHRPHTTVRMKALHIPERESWTCCQNTLLSLSVCYVHSL